MRRSILRTFALLTALILLMTALPALAAGAGTEYYMLSFQTGGYAYEAGLKTLYDNSLFSGVLFNGGKPFEATAPGRGALMGLLDAFKATPDADDIAYFHFVGTGYLKNGVAGIQLAGGDELPLTGLASALSALPCRICVLLDVKAAGVSPSAFNQQVKLAFSADKFQYLSACSATDAAFGGAPIPRATRILMTGFGLNPSTNALKAKNWPADANKNFSVSLKEAAAYLKAQSKKLKASDFNLALRMSGSGPNLYAFTGVSSFRIYTNPVTTRDTWTELYLVPTPANADAGAYLLGSSKPKVAYIDIYGDGVPGLTINGLGSTVVTAKSRLYPYPKATFKLTVQPIHSESVKIEAEYKDVTGKALEHLYGSDLTATGYVEPTDSDFQELTWKSSNRKVADVERGDESDGRDCYIAVKGTGTAVITATARDGVSASFTLSVPHVPVEGLYPVADTALPLHKKIYWGTITYPKGTLDGVTYKSSNPAVATIDSYGNIYGKKLGSTTITATSKDNPAIKIRYSVAITKDECVWPAPDLASLGSGMFFTPKRLSHSGRYVVCEMYFVNNTASPVSQIARAHVGVKSTDGYNGIHTESRAPLKLYATVPPGGVGTCSFQLDKSGSMSVGSLTIASFELPQRFLVPFVTAP